jgi:hypothetical protein
MCFKTVCFIFFIFAAKVRKNARTLRLFGIYLAEFPKLSSCKAHFGYCKITNLRICKKLNMSNLPKKLVAFFDIIR